MNSLLAIGIMTTLALSAIAGHIAAAKEYTPSVTVHLDVKANVPFVTIMSATGFATEIFYRAGVRLAWRMGQPEGTERRQPIIVEVVSNTPGSLSPGALACAEAFEGIHVRLFYDRLQKFADSPALPRFLGHVLAHEIAHILQRTDRHSPTGVMKAHWTTEDILQMSRGRLLSFEPRDIALIRQSLIDRADAKAGASLGSNTNPARAPAPAY